MRFIRSLVSAGMLLATMAIGAVVQTAPAIAQEVTEAAQVATTSLVASILAPDALTVGLVVAAIVVVAFIVVRSRTAKAAEPDLYNGIFTDPHPPRSPPD